MRSRLHGFTYGDEALRLVRQHPTFTNDMMFGGGPSTYLEPYALRLRAAASGYLARTPSGAGNRKTWTFSIWIKRATLGANQAILSGNFGGGTDYTMISFRSDDTLGLATGSGEAYTASPFLDPTAWLHVVVQLDTTQATAANRVKFFVNGVQQAMNGASAYPSINTDLGINSTEAHSLGRFQFSANQYLDAVIARPILVDGSIVAPTAFAETSAATGQWVPKTPAPGSYGTNGLNLNFADASTANALGTDRSGLGNNWTASGISIVADSTFDQSRDTPTNNCATLNPINRTDSSAILANANLSYTGGNNRYAASTMRMVSGKWYIESGMTAAPASGQYCFGVSFRVHAVGAGNDPGYSSDTHAFYVPTTAGNRGYWTNSAQVFNVGATLDQTRTYKVALDIDAGKGWLGYDAVWFNSAGATTGDPATGANPTFTFTPGTPAYAIIQTASGNTGWVNFGQRAFVQTAPTAFNALSAANENTPSIPNSRNAFYAETRAGTGAAASITTALFQPGLVVAKGYPTGSGTSWNVFDNLRGTGTGWNFNDDPNPSDYSDANTLTAFNSNGVSYGSDASSRGVNISGNTYVDFLWRLGAQYGVIAVQYTGNGSTQAIAHTMGVTPECIITKAKTNARRPTVLAPGLVATQYGYINMNVAFTASNAINRWGDNSVTVAPTSTHFTVGNSNDVNENGVVYIAYLFVSIPGFSRIFSYTGNGSSDGPFLPMDIKPRLFLIKDLGQVGGWRLWDAARQPNNGARMTINPNSGGVQQAENFVNFTSRGVKIITGAGAGTNDNGVTHLGMAFADAPSKFATAV